MLGGEQVLCSCNTKVSLRIEAILLYEEVSELLGRSQLAAAGVLSR